MSRNITARATYQTTFLLQLGLLMLALFFSLNVHAADSAGRLLFARGEVQITSVEAESRAAKRGDVLQVGDTIRTGVASSAQLRMSDGAMIALKAGTVYRIEAQDYNEKAPGEGSQVGELLRGGLRAITGAIGHEKPEAVKYRTPVATIGIRGTVFDTIVIPPEGLPELPGMAPGTYVMVLEGQVLLSTPTGELLLGPGEIGYVPFVDAPPELRPDLEAIFVEFAAFEEQDRPKTADGSDSYSRTAVSQRDSNSIYSFMADVSAAQILMSSGTSEATVSPGPYGISNVISTGNGINPYQGDFFSNPVTVGATYGDLQNATGGSGGISSYGTVVVAAPPVPQNTGSATAGNSTINWGQFGGLQIQLTDQTNTTIPIGSTDFVNYINATNVVVSTADLPTIGSYQYDYVGGSGQQLLAGSNLTVDFGTAQMDVTLVTDVFGTPASYTAANQNISAFYGNGITLNGTVATIPVTGSISGRFVGSQAEGAISGFILDVSDGLVAGTAVFAR